jgi:hypothetical protein
MTDTPFREYDHPPRITYSGPHEQFRTTSDPHIWGTFAVKHMETAERLADHDGQLKSFSTIIAAIQSSLSSWSATVIGLGTLLLAALAIFAAIQVYYNQKMDAKTDNLDAKVESVGKRVDSMATEIAILPSRVSQEIINAAGQIANITQKR